MTREARTTTRGYYGSNLDAVEDCLAGGFGPTPPFTLKWRRGGQPLSGDAWARESFWREVFEGGDESSTEARDVFEALIELLREHDVTVDIGDDPS